MNRQDEDTASISRVVVIEFDTKEQAQAWYDSPAYRKIMPLHQKSATSRVYIVEGTVTAPSH